VTNILLARTNRGLTGGYTKKFMKQAILRYHQLDRDNLKRRKGQTTLFFSSEHLLVRAKRALALFL
jgi:hypothetical protein